MTTFNPNIDYSTNNDEKEPSIYDAMIEVQQILEEINQLLTMQDQQDEPYLLDDNEIESIDETEILESIYDDIFE